MTFFFSAFRLLLVASLAPVLAFANEPAPTAANQSATTPAPLSEKNTGPGSETSKSIPENDYASLLRIGAAKLASGDADSARIAYRQVAQNTLNADEEARALLGLARAYRLAGDGVKATATYERLIKDHPAHRDMPTALLEDGRTLRDLGSPKLAISRFYAVLYSTLRLPEAEATSYRRLVRTAQFEIAETHFAMGNYSEAIRFFNRLDLVDLAETDRARARFKAAQARALAGDRPGAITALQAFITQDPDDANSPEARFILATLLSQLNRQQESLDVTLDLLRHEHGRDDGDPTRWRTWQRRTGNQLASQFYNQGEFTSALALYKALDALDNDPAWRIPILYQIGLCHERLMDHATALDTYRQITTLIAKSPAEFPDLARMTAWRIDQLSWWKKTQDQLNSLTPVRSTAQDKL